MLLDLGLEPNLWWGGLSMRPEMAQELGFDAGFGPDAPAEAAVDYVEGKKLYP